MKRIKRISLTALLIPVLALAGCGGPEVPPAGSDSALVTESSLLGEPVAEKFGLTPENLPVMDGSTSAIPLEAGLRAALFGLSQLETEQQVVHTTTHQSFEKLLNGECDLIFTVPISAEQEEAAREKGIVLEKIPVSAEGFVFVVNAENPVDGLTQQQLRDIYSGQITNWNQVGGEDREILAYQRNKDSGSQNYMTVFMGETPMAEAPSNLIVAGMAGILDAIAVYDNGADAIGYSVYSYAMDMYNEAQSIKTLAIDGVAATKENMANGSYPLLSKTYIMFRADEPEDSPVRRFVKFVQSPEGQEAVARSGYVPAGEE